MKIISGSNWQKHSRKEDNYGPMGIHNVQCSSPLATMVTKLFSLQSNILLSAKQCCMKKCL